jgi:outer membrane usher protein
VSLGAILTRRSVATVTHARTEDTGSTVMDLQRSLPLGSGIGYRFLGDTANKGSLNGLLQAQGRYGRVNLRHNYLNGRQTSTMDVSGGVVWTGGEVNLSRRIHDGYALVRVPAVPGIRVYLNDQIVGHTNRRGSVLVPNLLSYLGNPIRIADEDVPLDFELSRLRALVAPTWRGGGVVTFPALRLDEDHVQAQIKCFHTGPNLYSSRTGE